MTQNGSNISVQVHWMNLCDVWHATRTCAHACVWWSVICRCTRIPKQTKCQQTNGPRPTHSGTEGWSEPCVQREPTRRAIFVIVIEQRKKEMKGDRQKKKKEREPRRERDKRKTVRYMKRRRQVELPFWWVCLFKGVCVSDSSGVGVVVDEEEIGGNSVGGTINNDTTQDEMTFLDTENRQPFEPTCNHMWRTKRESSRVCVRWGVICTLTVAFMTVATVWTRNCHKEHLRNARDYIWILDSIELDNNWDFRSPTASWGSYERDFGVVVVVIAVATVSAILAIDGPKMKNSTTLSFLSMLRMKMTRKKSTSCNSIILSVVLLDCGIQCVILSCPQVRPCALSSTPLVRWARHLSCRVRFHIEVAVGKVLPDGWQSCSAIGPLLRCLRVFSLLLFLHPWLFFSMIHLPLVVSALSASWPLQDLLLFGPSYFDWVEVKRRMDTCLISLVPVSGKKTLNSRRGLSQFDQLHVAHLVKTRFDFSLKIILPFDKSSTDFVHDPILNFFIFWWFLSYRRMAFWDTLSTRGSITNCRYLSTTDSESRTTFLVLVGSSFVLLLTSLIPNWPVTSFSVLECQLLFSVIFCVGWRVFRTVLDHCFERLLCRCNFLAQDCVRWLHVTSLAKLQSSILRPG